MGSLKTVAMKEWNKNSNEIILNACNLFQRRTDKIIEKNANPIE